MKGRQIISILLLFFLSFNICSYVFVRAYHEGCTDYITESFCVNKNKPELHCNGQCHINKIIKTTSKSTDTLAISDNLLHVYLASSFHIPTHIAYVEVKHTEIHNSKYTNFYVGISGSIDIPPPLS